MHVLSEIMNVDQLGAALQGSGAPTIFVLSQTHVYGSPNDEAKSSRSQFSAPTCIDAM
jgi:hypothetical protein